MAKQAVIVESIARSVIHAWNPYGIVSGNPNDDEFKAEIKAVVKGVHRVNSALDAAHLLSRVFTSSFGDPERFGVEACTSAGQALWDALVREGLV